MPCVGEMPLRVEWVTGSDLSPLEPVWRELVPRDAGATIFQTWEWNSAWWRHFGPGRRLTVLVAFGAEGPLALAPLAARRGAGGSVRRIEFLGTGVSDYLGFIGPEAAVRACVPAFLEALEDVPGWDIVDLQQLSPPQAACVGIPSAATPARLPPPLSLRAAQQDLCPVIGLPSSWADLLPRLGKKMRSNLGYYERLLSRDFALSLETARAEGVDVAMEEFFSLHARRWSRRWQPGALFSRRRRDFHRDAARSLCEAGMLALHRLRVDGRTVAALYCFHHGGRAFYYLGGFDPEMARYSPGTVLTGYAIRAALDAGCREFDFLRGREPYKYRWPVVDRPTTRVEIGRTGRLRSALALQWSQWERRLEERAKRVVQPH